jgi:hypothetical protein
MANGVETDQTGDVQIADIDGTALKYGSRFAKQAIGK